MVVTALHTAQYVADLISQRAQPHNLSTINLSTTWHVALHCQLTVHYDKLRRSFRPRNLWRTSIQSPEDLRAFRSCWEPHPQSRRSFWTPEAPKGLFLRSVGASPPLEAPRDLSRSSCGCHRPPKAAQTPSMSCVLAPVWSFAIKLVTIQSDATSLIASNLIVCDQGPH
ncbi:hypothetical protein CROQUDRAFT_95458 [Cronartium quercuum f. sp. fusiforme G11]|uniref:Uncharacterized protein n=1 Tax=Cronartium quercuum f. sp. fusiforme G11 TaxID=708437 RepID=A0A9P6T9Y5_9BASI|nr:hypothetical protein CROQUDRAFT_95458 [Cronartium quercuum f. sp. fusiforme G11]